MDLVVRLYMSCFCLSEPWNVSELVNLVVPPNVNEGKCYSYVGRIYGQQRLSLGYGCHYFGTIIHELGHAVGFYHEQNRSDRDEYLIIYLENVAQSAQSNFRKLSPQGNILYNEFDYDSIMIYDNKSFSKNGKDTMVARNGQKLFHAYKKPGMTKNDIERVNKMYKCDSY
nr:astacin-like metalloprotease toxin 4 [Parasteatoda tepidariorum]